MNDSPASNDILTEVSFWMQVMGDAKRTIVCSPDLESRVKGWIDARGMGHLLKMVANQACPDNRIIIIDEQALAADLAASIQRYRPRALPRNQ